MYNHEIKIMRIKSFEELEVQMGRRWSIIPAAAVAAAATASVAAASAAASAAAAAEEEEEI